MSGNKNIIENEIAADIKSVGVDLLVSPPFYEDEYTKIYNMDCLTGMIALRPFDVIVTDPPYGIGAARNGTTGGDVGFKKNGERSRNIVKVKDYGKQEWDIKKLPRIYLELMKYVSRHQVIFGGNYYGEYLGDTKSYIVWDKDNSGNFADCELAWTSYDRAVRKIKHRWNGMLQQNMKEKEYRQHPTQKPLPVMIEIIENYTNASDLVCDPFMGSGTTLVAAKSLERKAVGFEINPKYCIIAAERLKAVQTRLIFGRSG
ncbi:MAG: site-specific DNA-methyltransferase [Patescibacteria group bacterium]